VTPPDLGIGARELVAIVGAGGKSTLLLGLGRHHAEAGRSVVMTTTTKMGADQLPTWAVPCRTVAEVSAAVASREPAFLFTDIDSSKIVGASANLVDVIFALDEVDYVFAEADGAAGQSLKAPADHEPVIPLATTVVIVVASLAAIGGRIVDVTHRPERVAALLGCGEDHVLEPDDLALVLSHPRGGLWHVSETARVIVVLTGAGPTGASDQIRAGLTAEPRIERVVVWDGTSS
jgi:molybdenum cofactor cytidylyltransferase